MVPTPPVRTPDGTLEVVTTHLELRQQPRPLRVSILSRTLAVVHAQRFPLHFYRYLYDTVGSPYLWWERREMDDQELAAIVLDERVELHVLQVDGVPAGFAELDRRNPEHVVLEKFGLIPDYLGQGLGLHFLGRVVDIAWREESVQRVTVKVASTDHPRALLIHQRIGFQAYNEVREQIDDPRGRGLFPELDEDAPANTGPTPVQG